MGLEIATIAAIGAVVSAGGAIYSGIAQKDAAEFQAAQASNQAAAEKDAALAHAEKIRKATRAQASAANAQLAASGVATGSGTALRIDEDITRRGEEDAYMTILTGQRQSRVLNEQASLIRAQGSAAQTAGFISALGAGAGAYAGWKKR